MKKTILTIVIALAAIVVGLAQQVKPAGSAGVSLQGLTPNLRNGLQISLRGGYDILPKFSVKEEPAEMKYVKLKGGPYTGAGVDYYWDWIGVGADFDYIKNSVGFDTEPFKKIDFQYFKTTTSGITRMFYGAGPNFRYLDPACTFSAELNTRVGLGSVKGGESHLDGYFSEPTGSPNDREVRLIDFGGFEASNTLSFKGQVRLTYFVSPVVGISWGVYYMHHTKVKYKGGTLHHDPEYTSTKAPTTPVITPEVIGNYSSIGTFAGVTFRISPPPVIPKPPVEKVPENPVINGIVVVCGTTQPIEGVSIVVKEKKNGQERILTSNKAGEFSFVVTPTSELVIYGKKANFFSQVVTLGPADIKRYRNVRLEICMERADCDESVRLNNIHYDLDKYNIRPDARPELDRLVQFLRDNPEVKVELSSHTDSRASHEYNERLSQNRANSAREYVISRGIDPSRVISVGYGETRLLNRCADGVPCSEAEHQQNRRTEMKVICPK